MKNLLIIVLAMIAMIQVGSLWGTVSPAIPSAKIQNRLQLSAIRCGLGDPGSKILNAVSLSAKQTGISETLLLSLMYTESSFNAKAKSSLGYQGLMQIPQKVHYEDANTLIGARIFLEKLKITNGDYRKAVTIYKGWPINHPEGKRQADKVLKLARRLKGE